MTPPPDLLNVLGASSPAALHLPLWLAAQLTLGALATLGFAVWFNVPRETLWRVVLVGALGVALRQTLNLLGQPPAVSSFWAALLIGVVGLRRAKSLRYPRVIFTVTGIIPLVPGIAAYESLVRFTEGDTTRGLASLVRAALVVGALAGGLTAARALTFPRRLRG